MKRRNYITAAFSLVEVVVALGVISFAMVAILGVFPLGLKTGHSAQDETRAAKIAQDILSSIASQAQTRYPNVTIKQSSTNFSYDIDLSQSIVQKWMSADNDGNLVIVDPTSPADELKYPFQIIITVAPDPPGFDPGHSSEVTVRIVTPPSPNPDQSPTGNQTVRDYMRIITNY